MGPNFHSCGPIGTAIIPLTKRILNFITIASLCINIDFQLYY